MLFQRVTQLVQDLKIGLTWAVVIALEVICQHSPIQVSIRMDVIRYFWTVCNWNGLPKPRGIGIGHSPAIVDIELDGWRISDPTASGHAGMLATARILTADGGSDVVDGADEAAGCI